MSLRISPAGLAVKVDNENILFVRRDLKAPISEDFSVTMEFGGKISKFELQKLSTYANMAFLTRKIFVSTQSSVFQLPKLSFQQLKQ